MSNCRGSSQTARSNVRIIIEFPYRLFKKIKIKSAKSRLYKLTPTTYFGNQELFQDAANWDIVICGSDQIWNYNNTGFDTTYLLDFINNKNKKISYAASFGVNKLEDKYKSKYKHLLNQIACLSVREVSGHDIIKDLIGIETEVVLDPTLLFNRSDWLKFSKKIIHKRKFILLYTLYNTKHIHLLAELLSQSTGYQIIKIAKNIKDFVYNNKVVIPTPEEFVGLIANAEYIITDSFHGTVFSINLNKEFYCLLETTNKNNDRIINILETLGLDNRILYDSDKDINLNPIDYDSANVILEEQRIKSLTFLKQSLTKNIQKNQ